jgi:hypothetical protein
MNMVFIRLDSENGTNNYLFIHLTIATMKKLTIIITCFAFISLTISATQNPVDHIFQKYADIKGVTSIHISRGMINMLANLDSSDKDLQALAGSINSISIIHAAKSMENIEIDFYRESMKDFPAAKYNELMRVNSPDQYLLFLVDEMSGNISELLIIGGGKENVLISIKGNIDLNKLTSLASIDVPGMNHLLNLQK